MSPSSPPPGERPGASPEDVTWGAVRDLYLDALELDAADREALLEAADEPLRSEVARMLAAGDGDGLGIDRWLLPDHGPENAAADPLPAGFVVGAYRVEQLLGRGGMGEVYRAARVDGRFEQRVAIKVLATDARASRELLRRFERERRVQARLDHPGIARMFDGGELEGGRPYLVMELVEGTRLTDFCDERRLPVDGRLRLLARVCDAVQHAHSRLVIHRDLKPDNILVTEGEGGEEPMPKLLDFGIAKLLESEALDVTSLDSRQSARPMTPRYAAPEQFAGDVLTTATDVYALGILICVLAAGESPHGRESSVAALERRVRDGTVPTAGAVFAGTDRVAVAGQRNTTPDRLRRILDGDLKKIVAKALHLEPARRYQSAGELGRDLRRYLAGEAVEAREDSAFYRLQVFVRRNRAVTGLAAAFAVALVALSSVLAVQTVRASRAARQAESERHRSTVVVDTMVEFLSGADARRGPTGDTISVARFLERMERVADSMQGDPALHAEMLSTLGQIHAGRENSLQASELLDRAISLQRRALERRGATATDGARDRLLSLEQQAARVLCEVDQGVSIERLRELLERIRRDHGAHDRRAHVAAIDLARCLDPQEALAAVDELLPRLRASLPGDDLLTLRAEVVRGEKLTWLGRHDEARQLFERVAEQRELQLGLDHPETLAVRRLAIATLPVELSLEPQRQLIERQERVFGADSAPVAASLDSLGVALVRLGQIEEATASLSRSLEIQRALHGPDSRLTANTARNLGMLHGLLGRYVEGAELLGPLVETSSSGRSGPYVAAQLAFLQGRAASAHGRPRSPAEQQALVRSIAELRAGLDALEAIRRGPDDRYPSDVRSFLARLLLASGEIRTARSEALEAVRDMRGAKRPRKGPIAQAELVAARAGMMLGEPGAEAAARQALSAMASWGASERLEIALAERELAQRTGTSVRP